MLPFTPSCHILLQEVSVCRCSTQSEIFSVVIHFRILAGKTELASEKSLYFDFTENGQRMNQVAHGSPP